MKSPKIPPGAKVVLKVDGQIISSVPSLVNFSVGYDLSQPKLIVKCTGKFKIGDMVRTRVNFANESSLPAGEKVTIISQSPEGYEVKDRKGEVWYIHEENLKFRRKAKG